MRRTVLAGIGREELGLGVIGDIVAAHVIAAVAAQPSACEELHLVGLAVVFNTLSLAVDILIEALALLAKGGQIACGHAILKALGVLLYGNAVGADDQSALCQDGASLKDG